MRVLLAVLALLAAYVPAALILGKPSHPDNTILSRPFIRLARTNAFRSFPVLPGAVADDEDHRKRASLALYEDDKLLGPDHSAGRDLLTDGGGRYLFWRSGSNMLIFSTSDSSDPNTNGRTYRVSDPGARDPYQAQRR